MKKMFALVATMGVLLSISNFSFAQEEEGAERILVLREAKQHKKTTVAVEAYLISDMLEVTVMVRMYAGKPSIFNVILVGPKLGRISPKTSETVTATVEDEAPFPTTKRGGFISFGKKTETKEAKGTLTKELFRFRIPTDKIVPGKRYQIWVKVQSRKGKEKGKIRGFKFDLESLAQLISQ